MSPRANRLNLTRRDKFSAIERSAMAKVRALLVQRDTLLALISELADHIEAFYGGDEKDMSPEELDSVRRARIEAGR